MSDIDDGHLRPPQRTLYALSGPGIPPHGVQVDALTTQAIKDKIEVRASHSDGAGTPPAERTGLIRALRQLRRGDFLAVYSPGCLSDDPIHEAWARAVLKVKGCYLFVLKDDRIPVTQTAVDKVASYYRALRWHPFPRKKGRGELSHGGYGGTVPYGFRVVPGTKSQLEPHPEEQNMLACLFAMAETGATSYAISKALKQKGFRSRVGTPLSIRRIDVIRKRLDRLHSEDESGL